MTVLPVTPLERVEDAATPIFLKREDLLPYGGGNKVPRFLHALSGRGAARRVAAFSDYGSHSFSVLAAMLRDPALGLEALELWERPVPSNPYRHAIARRYAETPGVLVRRGSTAGLLARWLARGALRRRGTHRLGIGGTVRGSAACYQPAADACASQLADHGVAGAVTHVIALASGDTARAVLGAVHDAGRRDDEVVGVMTGSWAGHARLRLRRPPGLHLVRPRACTWDDYVERARACHARTGVWLDPEHTLPAWDALPRLPAHAAGNPIVFWVTCPRIETPPFEL